MLLLQDLLQGKWLAMAGDSIARSLYASLLRMFDDDDSSEVRRVAYGHQSFEYTLPGDIRASFIWAPYTANVTEHIKSWCAADTRSDLLSVERCFFSVVSGCCWLLHMQAR